MWEREEENQSETWLCKTGQGNATLFALKFEEGARIQQRQVCCESWPR